MFRLPAHAQRAVLILEAYAGWKSASQEVEKYKSPRMMWRIGRNGEPNPFEGWGSRARPNPLLPHALGSIAIDQREIRGRKVVVWIGPRWPVHGGDIAFDDATELSTRLREARITLDNVNVWPNSDQSFNYHDYLEAPRSQKDMQPAKMALQVIATHTGGLVLDSSGDLDRDIERCVEEVRSFYTRGARYSSLSKRHEVVEKKKKLGKRSVVRGVRARDLEISGTFGPSLPMC
jgi:hypothetical protein